MLKFSSIPQGKGFGELALLENKPRSATVLALGEVWWAILYKGAYDTILKKLERDKINRQIAELDSFLLFSTLTNGYKTKFLKGVEKVEFVRGHVLYEEHQHSDSLYLILDGSFEVSKTFQLVSVEGANSVHYSKLVPSTEFIEKLKNVRKT
jgi:CRP-like cAMP-binding protein